MKILIFGGSRFFGKKLAKKLVDHHEVFLMNRGNLDDGLSDKVNRLRCDRTDKEAVERALGEHNSWDLVYDHCCYNAQEARDACKVFNGKVGKYIFISSQSVYGDGENISEDTFDPINYEFNEDADRYKNYSEAKRQAESIFFQNATFPVVAVRFPIVVGEDDYTKRLLFHIERIKNQEPIHIPNIEAKISFINSSDAADALLELSEKEFKGPLNIASSRPIELIELIGLIEEELNKEMIFTNEVNDEVHSPYGIKSHWYMSTDKLNKIGIKAREIKEWLPNLIKTLSR